MNKNIHRVLWNAAKGCWTAASEKAGLRQSRGSRVRAAAVLSASPAALAAASLEEGVLASDKANVVVGDQNLASHLTRPFLSEEEGDLFVIGGPTSVSSVAAGIKNLHITDDTPVTFEGENVDLTATNVWIWTDPNSPTAAPVVHIGEEGADRTAAKFGKLVLGHYDDSISTGSRQGELIIQNADAEINDLRLIANDFGTDVGNGLAVAADGTAKIAALHFNGGRLTNSGLVEAQSIDSLRDSANDHYANRIGNLINEEGGTLRVADHADGLWVFENAGEAEFGSLTLEGGSYYNAPGQLGHGELERQSVNTGTITVQNAFVLGGHGTWGAAAEYAGVLTNAGMITAGTASIYGDFTNEETGAFSTTGDLTVVVSDATPRGDYPTFETRIRNSGKVSAGGELKIDGAGAAIENAAGGEIEATSGFVLTKGGVYAGSGSLKADGDSQISGNFRLNGGMAELASVTFNPDYADSDLETYGGPGIYGGAVVNVSESLTTTSGFSISEGTVAGGENAVLTIGDGNSVATVTVKENGSLTGFSEAALKSQSYLLSFGTAEHALDLGKLTIEEYAELSVGGAGEEGASDGRIGTLENSGSVSINGTLSAQSFSNNGTVDDIGTDMSDPASGTLIVTGQLLNNGSASIDVAKAEIGSLTSAADSTARFGELALDGGTINGFVQAESALVSGELDVSGAFTAQNLTLDGAQMTVSGETTRTFGTLATTSKGAQINLDGASLNVSSLSGSSHLLVNFMGQNSALNILSGEKLEGAVLNMNERDWTFSEAGDGFGKNTVNLWNGSDAFFSGAAALTNETALTVNADTTVSADAIDFSESGAGGLTLAGGTLTTTLGQIFESVSAESFIEGFDPETGETVQIPLSGIQSVGAVKDQLTGEHGIRYESGAFEFTDDGWTVNAVNSTASQLKDAFSADFTSGANLIFSGDQETEAGAFTVADANDLADGIVLSGTVLANDSGKSEVVFGAADGDNPAASYIGKTSGGYQAVAGADAVSVVVGSHLYLVGFAGDGASNLLTTAADGGAVLIDENAVLTLGLAGRDVSGSLASASAAGGLEVQGGRFNVGDLTLSGTGSLTVAAGAELSVDAFNGSGAADSSSLVNRGTLAFAGNAALYGQAENYGTITAAEFSHSNDSAQFLNEGEIHAASAAFADLKNSGIIDATAQSGSNAFAAEKLENAGTIKAQTVEIGMNAEGDGRFTETFVNAGSIEAADSVVLDLAGGEASNSGTITAASLTGDLAESAVFTNSGSIDIEGALEFAANDGAASTFVNAARGKVTASSGAFSPLQNSGSVTIEGDVALAVENLVNNQGGVLSASSIALEAGSQFENRGTINADVALSAGEGQALENAGTINGALNVELSGEGASFVNAGEIHAGEGVIAFTADENAEGFMNAKEGTLEAAQIVQTGGRVVNQGVVKADALALENGASFANEGEMTLAGSDDADAAALSVGENAVFTNSGSLSASSIRIGGSRSIEQSATGTIETADLTVVGATFDLGSGTWIITNEEGISFVNESGEAQKNAVVNVTSGVEYATAQTAVEGIAYNVSKTLTFGTEAQGTAAALDEKSEAVKAALANDSGVLTLGSAVTIGEGGSITLGSSPATASVSLFDEAGGEAGAAEGEAGGDAFYAAAGSATIFAGSAFGADGTSAALSAAQGTEQSAVIEKGAKAVLTGIQHSGAYTLLSGFDLSKNLESGEWAGGWTGDDSEYVSVENGSDLDWLVEVSYDKASNALVAEATAADVRTVYDLAVPDIANAALRADASAGADVRFLQAVINNEDLSVRETEKVVNSVAQIAGSLGVAANALSDASSLMDTVESRVGFAESRKGSGLWVKAEGGKYKTDSLSLSSGMDAGYDADTYGFTFGADAEVRPGLRLGAAFSYLNGSADSEGDVLSGTNDYVAFGLQAYGAWDAAENIRLVGEVGWFRSSAELEQTIARADVRKATADVETDAVTFGVRVEGKFDFAQAGGLTLIPHVGLRGIWLMNDDFETKIDGEKAFRSDQDDTFTMQLPIGATVQKSFSTASGWTVSPWADVTVTPQFGDTDFETAVTGVGTGVSETVTADMAGNVTGRLSLGVRAQSENVELGAHYGFTAGDAGRQDQAFGLSFSYKF